MKNIEYFGILLDLKCIVLHGRHLHDAKQAALDPTECELLTPPPPPTTTTTTTRTTTTSTTTTTTNNNHNIPKQ